ncbi:MAG: adenylate/guanylate cyclase domain-containing protein [Acidobacteria bacterium]|nr:adenylate/guanylate cyclase domain-containing protein [Acidobacteriota bacterium]
MINKRTRGKLNKHLRERNEYPERSLEIDARIRELFGETLAILVMDMSGFSKQTVRHGIIHFLAKIHRMHAIAIPAVESRKGEIVKLEADNIYAVFNEVEEAVGAALDIQTGLEAANSILPEELDMHGEYGIGYGEVLVIENEDIYGSELNLASKLGEDLAQRDEILLTESAFKQVENSGREFEHVAMTVSGLDLKVYRVKRTIV